MSLRKMLGANAHPEAAPEGLERTLLDVRGCDIRPALAHSLAQQVTGLPDSGWTVGDEIPDSWAPEPRVIVIGVFDGVHLGHVDLFSQALEDARQRDVGLQVVTFDRDPDEFFRAGGQRPAPFKLLTNAERVELLTMLDARVLPLPSSERLFSASPEAFLKYMKRFANPVSVHVGEGFRFGARAAGDDRMLAHWCAEHGVAANIHALYEEDGKPVSATRVRKLLEESGDVGEASRLCCGRLHHIRGRVEHGRGEGTGMGFATANLTFRGVANGVMLPAEGVYSGLAQLAVTGAGQSAWGAPVRAAVNVGVAKSFEDAHAQVEAHLLDVNEELYGRELDIWFVERLRDQRRFDDVDELVATVTADIRHVRETVDPLAYDVLCPNLERGRGR